MVMTRMGEIHNYQENSDIISVAAVTALNFVNELGRINVSKIIAGIAKRDTNAVIAQHLHMCMWD